VSPASSPSRPGKATRPEKRVEHGRGGAGLNIAPRTIRGAHPIPPLLSVSDPAVVVEAVKLAEDRSGDVIVRLYESRGGRARATVTLGADLVGAQEVDLLERPMSTGAAGPRPDGFTVELRPFQILSVRVSRRPQDAAH
jgi:alpha-mannosidase